ncbi:MAG: BlaI/MecI/CopY family transcriptional regulator [Pseudomonadota bacterium]
MQRVLELGPREVELLTILWRDGDATANQVYHRLEQSSVTVNTIHSALERLHRKGFVLRDKSGRSFLYRPTLTREQLICQSLVIVADRLAGGDVDLMIDAVAAYLCGDAVALTASARQRLLAGLY